jgi:hypothetical protein
MDSSASPATVATLVRDRATETCCRSLPEFSPRRTFERSASSVRTATTSTSHRRHLQKVSTQGYADRNEPALCRPGARAQEHAIAPNELIPAIHDHLWSIGSLGREPRSIRALPDSKEWRGVRVLPSEVVPVGDMLTDTYDELSSGRLLQMNLSQEDIGGRATRTALGGEKLDD